MPKVGVDNEPLLERVMFGYDGTNYRIVKIDTDGNLVAAIKTSQSVTVLQSNPVNLKATVINTPRMPSDATLEQSYYQVSLANGSYNELLSRTTGAGFANVTGSVIDDGKRLAVAWVGCGAALTTGFFQINIGYDSTILIQATGLAPAVEFAPPLLFYVEGNGTRAVKVCGRNQSGVTKLTTITAMVWEEDS